jgi:hypothetical protein
LVLKRWIAAMAATRIPAMKMTIEEPVTDLPADWGAAGLDEEGFDPIRPLRGSLPAYFQLGVG